MSEKIEQEDLKTLHESMSALRKSHEESKGKMTETIEKANAKIDQVEEKYQAQLLETKKAEKEALELKEKVDKLDKALCAQSQKVDVTKSYRDSDEYKSMMSYCVKGESKLTEDELKALSTSTNTEGGYLVPEGMYGSIIKQIEEVSPVRALARVLSGMEKTIQVPKRTGIPTARYEGEKEPAQESSSSYANERLTAFRQTHQVNTTHDLLNFSAYNVEQEIMGDSQEAFAVGEGLNFLTGDGAGKPEGILANANIARTSTPRTTSSVDPNFDHIIRLAGDLKVGYNGMYAFNKKTASLLRTVKDSDGRYLWQVGGTEMPMQIAGYNYVILQHMQDYDTAGNIPVLFGDFFRGYMVYDAIGMTVIRDLITQASSARVLFTVSRWNTGKVVLAEAFKALRTT